jgi:hypothetical protein
LEGEWKKGTIAIREMTSSKALGNSWYLGGKIPSKKNEALSSELS